MLAFVGVVSVLAEITGLSSDVPVNCVDGRTVRCVFTDGGAPAAAGSGALEMI